MKKILALVIGIILVVSLLSSCTVTIGSDDKGLDAAYEYVLTMYKDKPTITPSDFDVIAVVTIEGEAFPITWEVEVTKGDANSVKLVKSEDGKTVKVDIDEKVTSSVDYNLTFKIEKNGNACSAGFAHSIPEYKLFSWQQYVDAAEDETLTVRGIVTGIISKSLGDSYNCLYFEDDDGGYYAYGMATDPVEQAVEIGDEVYVTGKRTTYSGTWEIKEASFEVVSHDKDVDPKDITELYKNASSLKDEALAKLQSSLVTIKDVEVTGQDKGSGYYKFKLGSLESYVRISSSVCPLNAADTTAFIEDHTTHFGYIADVTGVVCLYDGAFYLTPVSLDAFDYKSLPQKSDKEMIEVEKGLIKFPATVTDNTTFDLLPTGTTYTQVKIEWSIVSGACATLEDGALVITIPDSDETVVLKAVFTSGNEKSETTYSINVVATELSYKQIVDAAYALAGGEKLDGTYRLYGEIIRIDTAYSEEYKNITVTIVVDGLTEKPIQCFRLKGEGVADLAVGDFITVEGILKNYVKNDVSTIEFDAGCVLLGTEEVLDQSKILKAAYALAGGEKMANPSILTGVIKTIDTAYSEEYKNITVTIVCPGYDDYPIQCFRLKGEGASLLAVGDKITVVGFLKNYVKNDVSTIEFDAGCVLVPNAKYHEVKTVLSAYRLEGGKTLPEKSTLTGVIKTIDTAYSEEYKNITVTIVVAGLEEYPIQCFRLKGEGVDTLAVGDEIYVTGTLKNYVKNEVSTIEFDAGCELIGKVITTE